MADDYSASVHTTGSVQVGGSVTGEIETAGDRDWFAVQLKAGRWYRIDVEMHDAGNGALEKPANVVIWQRGDKFSTLETTIRPGSCFGPETDVTYYVEVAGREGDTGHYRLSVTEIADDFTAGTDTTGAVTVGGSVTGEIEWADDSDWFAVTLEAGKTYIIDLKGKDTGDGTLEDPYLDGVYGADGNVVQGVSWNDNGGEGRNGRATVTVEEGGTYYVAAGAAGVHTGTYTLSVAEVVPVAEGPAAGDLDDFAHDASTTGAVTVGGSVTGEIERADDSDWFAVTLEAGKTYRIDLKGKDTGDGTLEDPYLDRVYGADGNMVQGVSWNDNGGEGRNSRATVTVEEGGTYYVAAGAAGAHTGTYTLSIAEVVPVAEGPAAEDPDDFAHDASTTGAVTVGGSVTGEIERADDSDWFAVTLEAGKTYRIDLKGKDTGDGTLEDPYLDGVYGADGNVVQGVSWNDNGGEGRNGRATVTVEEGGTHYVAAGASGMHTGTYTLSVTEVPSDLAADASTTGRVTVGGSVASEIERTHDSDWFAVTLEAGKTYRIDLKGKDTGDGALGNPYLWGVYDKDGDLVDGTWDDNGGKGRNSRTTFTAEEGGTHYVAAGAAGKHKGTYTLSIAEVPSDLAADASTTGVVTVGGSVTGEIERAHDSDWFAVTLEADKTYIIDLKGRASRDGTLKDPHLDGVYDADGDPVGRTWNDNGGEGRNSRATVTVEEGGTYYVAAGASGTHKGTYTLSIAEVPSDLAADASTTGVVTVGGSVTGEIERAHDSDWFAVTLETGKTYIIDLKGRPSRDGTLKDPASGRGLRRGRRPCRRHVG